jgi:hypothetical protein
MEKQHYPLIRTIYLYLFALVGLALLIIGTVRFIDMGLKAFVFTKADQQEHLYSKRPPMPYQIDKVKEIAEDEKDENLTEQEVILIKNWLAQYQEWQEESSKIDPIVSRRHRDASTNLSMIIVGLPLFLYHWRIIRRETKKNS